MPYTYRNCGMLSVGINISFQHNTSNKNLNLSNIGWLVFKINGNMLI